jgi:hypothetical protein
VGITVIRARSAFQARLLVLALRQKLQQGGARHRGQHVGGGEIVDLTRDNGQAFGDCLGLPGGHACEPSHLVSELLCEQPRVILGQQIMPEDAERRRFQCGFSQTASSNGTSSAEPTLANI